MDGTTSSRITELDRFMQGAGFDAHLSSAIRREMWDKWLFLASLGAVTCLMRGTVGEIAATPDGPDFVLQLLAEVTAIVKAAELMPSDTFLAEISASLTAKGSPLTSSMYRDLQKGSAIEADQIIGDLLARGRQMGVEAPLLSAAYAHLCVYQDRLPR